MAERGIGYEISQDYRTTIQNRAVLDLQETLT